MRLEPLPDPLRERDLVAWQLGIDLRGTTASGFAPKRMDVRSLDGTWLRCHLTAQRFDGAGSEVEAMIAVFRRWIDAPSPDSESTVFEAASAV